MKAFVAVLSVLVSVLAPACGGLPFQNPLTQTMMKMNDGAKVREILEDLDSRGEVC